MRQRLLILGAGGTSREIAGAVEDLNRVEPRWDLIGFLDDDTAKHGSTINGVAVLGPIDAVGEYGSCLLICGIASYSNPLARRRVIERLQLAPERFATIVHPSASISPYARIGVGSAILQHVVITADTVVGDHVILLQNACLAHDDLLGDFVTVAPGAVITGYVKLGEGAYIGAGSTIMAGTTIGRGAIVGIGSVVLNDVSPERTVFGNPARALPTLRP